MSSTTSKHQFYSEMAKQSWASRQRRPAMRWAELYIYLGEHYDLDTSDIEVLSIGEVRDLIAHGPDLEEEEQS